MPNDGLEGCFKALGVSVITFDDGVSAEWNRGTSHTCINMDMSRSIGQQCVHVCAVTHHSIFQENERGLLLNIILCMHLYLSISLYLSIYPSIY